MKCVFNFSSSPNGGGLKRLIAFAKFYEEVGGAIFIVNKTARAILPPSKNNTYIVMNNWVVCRILNINHRLKKVLAAIGPIDAYYSYSLPVPRFVTANIRLLHISNVLPFVPDRFLHSYWNYLRFRLIRLHLVNSFKNCTHIAGDSKYTINLLSGSHACNEVVLENGSDDEIAPQFISPVKENVAVSVGTHNHKDLLSTYKVFQHLKKKHSGLNLIIIGAEKAIPKTLISKPDVICTGLLPRAEVIRILSAARYYISTTLIESSFNAASEGVKLTVESFISDIQPHREMLEGEFFELVSFDGVLPLIHVHSSTFNGKNLRTWNSTLFELNKIFAESCNV